MISGGEHIRFTLAPNAFGRYANPAAENGFGPSFSESTRRLEARANRNIIFENQYNRWRFVLENDLMEKPNP
jgi:hypothetical protein